MPVKSRTVEATDPVSISVKAVCFQAVHRSAVKVRALSVATAGRVGFRGSEVAVSASS